MIYMLEIEYDLPDHTFYYRYAIQHQGDYDVIIFVECFQNWSTGILELILVESQNFLKRNVYTGRTKFQMHEFMQKELTQN